LREGRAKKKEGMLIIIQIGRTVDELKIREVIQSRLKPDLNQSISTVLVIASKAETRDGKRIPIQFKDWIEHPNPKNPLDTKLRETIPFPRSLACTYLQEIRLNLPKYPI